MNRRYFLKKSLMVGTVFMGPGLNTWGCSRDLRGEMVGAKPSDRSRGELNPEEWSILFHASLAPSGHNSQPWFIRREKQNLWVVGSDRNRWLPAVDPENREVLLSIGAFVENLVQAAEYYGYEPELEFLAKDRFDADVIRVRLVPGRTVGGRRPGSLERIKARRTIKSGFSDTELTLEDVKGFEKAAGRGLYYFPRGSRHGEFMAQAAIESFEQQFRNEAAMAEAALWTRLSDREAKKFMDGLTTDGMEIEGVAGWWVRHFMDTNDVTGEMWREKAIEKVISQARQGGGWLVLTSPGNRVEDLIHSGRSFQRMALEARERGIGLHPMTQTLEEVHGQRLIRDNHKADMIPQFMLRVGYVAPYPKPVSLRRPVDWFIL